MSPSENIHSILGQEERNHGKLLQVISFENLVAADSTLAGNVKDWNAYFETPTLEERMQKLEQPEQRSNEREGDLF